MSHTLDFLVLLLLIFTITKSGPSSSGHVENSNLTLYWNFTSDNYIEVEIQWQQPTSIALLLGGKMTSGDLWLCSKQADATEWGVYDYWSYNYAMPVDDTKRNGTDDLEAKSITETASGHNCRFRRKMVTGDSTDIELQKGSILRVCYLKSTTQNMTKHQKHRANLYCFNWPLYEGYHAQLRAVDNNWPYYHGIVMSIAWGLLVDFAIMAVRYFKTLKFYTATHGILFFLINAASIPFIILMIVLHKAEIFYNFATMNWKTKTHLVVGVVFLLSILVQHTFGVISKFYQEKITEPANTFLKFRKAHRISGYVLYFIAKGQIALGWYIYTTSFSSFLIALVTLYGATLLLHIALRILYVRNRLFIEKCFQRRDSLKPDLKLSLASEQILDAVLQPDLTLEKMNELFSERKWVLFKDKVCDFTGFNHPGGSSLLANIQGKDVSKYIYGGATVEGNTTYRHRHTEYATKYLEANVLATRGLGIAEIADQDGWELQNVARLADGLFKLTFSNAQFKLQLNPRNPNLYLGRFFLVTTPSATRTYTLVLSQNTHNIRVRQSLLESYHSEFQKPVATVSQKHTNELVLIIKKYKQGVVSRQVHQGVTSIEGLYGQGLNVRQGHNLIITGGTGILPFLDLFDLLLRKAVTLAAADNKDSCLIDGVDYSQALRGSTFEVYASFSSEEEALVYSWLSELDKIDKKHSLGLIRFRVKCADSPRVQGFESFSGRITREFAETEWKNLREVTKVYVCGPGYMNDSVYLELKAAGLREEQIDVL